MPNQRPSSIDRLPEEVRQLIAKLRSNGSTLEEIIAHLQTLDVSVSRSALGRWAQRGKKISEGIRRSREVAEVIGREFGGKEASVVNRTNIEFLHSIVLQIMAGEEGEDVNLKAIDAMRLSAALANLSKAAKTDLDGEIKAAVERERRAALEQAVARVETAMQGKGLSAETVNAIKANVLGVTA